MGSAAAPTGSGSAAGGEESSLPENAQRARSTAQDGVALPRLAQYASLGSRRPPAGRRDPQSQAAATNSTSDQAPDAGDGPDPLLGGTARRRRLRVGLALVGVLAAAGLVVAFSMGGTRNGEKDDGASSFVKPGDYGAGADLSDDLPHPSADPSGKPGEHSPKSSASPSRGSAPGHGSASPKDLPAPPAPRTTGPTATRPVQPPPAPSAGVPGTAVYSHASGRCIDVVGGRAVQGAALQIWDCSKAASQRWTFAADGTMRALGMCVQLAGGSTADGTNLELARCDGGPAQSFGLNSDHDLVSGLADKCADVRDLSTANGSRLQLWSCAGSDNQKWSAA
ncbi:ricin-type beta-trefoil lectin domain protein [Streptomyces sp. NPDC006012]|uniref:ricin-type beta-trefoil lectin domain protein n=1 Tax=Streptomyces sp. NPDC006012 TaxID=3364739 RepID=UPI003681ED10